ncbi:hypothetical protein EDB86DRAFT_2945870 [Lactarius hatsudake]|nr:hypothetical protein EDB86DRAFT_2945870 [Lactarius hatsudake]
MLEIMFQTPLAGYRLVAWLLTLPRLLGERLYSNVSDLSYPQLSDDRVRINSSEEYTACTSMALRTPDGSNCVRCS